MTIDEAINILEDGNWWEELGEWYIDVNTEYDRLHEAVDMAIEALKEKKEEVWISVEERLPDMDGEYIVKVDGKTKPFVLSFGFFGSKKIGMWYDDEGIAYSGITHWKK